MRFGLQMSAQFFVALFVVMPYALYVLLWQKSSIGLQDLDKKVLVKALPTYNSFF